MIEIIYEDNHILVVNKPVNIPVQQDNSQDVDLLSELKQMIKLRDHKPGNVYLALVHRLDRPVGGVMVFAKTSKAASRLSESIRTHQLKKVYTAVIDGRMDKDQGRLEDHLVKDKIKNMVKTTDKHDPNGKYSALDYTTIASTHGLTMVKVTLITGRSHQIRVQFASRNHPLWGDQRYNPNAIHGQQIALYASSMTLPHPINKTMMTFDHPLPDKFPYNIFNTETGKDGETK